MELNQGFFFSIFGLCAGLYFFYKGLKWLGYKRLIENTPTSSIRSLAMGLVEIYGEAIPIKNTTLKSPLSNNPCVYYKCTIEELRKSGKSSRWVTIKSEVDGIHFHLKDDSGHVLIDPRGAEIDIPKDTEYKSGMGYEPTEQIKQYMMLQNLSHEGFLGINKTMRFREYFIAPGDKLYIMGTAGDNPYVGEATAHSSVEDIMIQKGSSKNIYYISDSNEKKLLEGLKWKCIGGVFGGAIIGVICLLIILVYLKLL